MNILIINFGTVVDNLIASSVIQRISLEVECFNLDWAVYSKNDKYIFDYNKYIRNVYSFDELKEVHETYDLLINYSPGLSSSLFKGVEIKEALGFGFDPNVEHFVDIIKREKSCNKSLFYIYYKIAGLHWKGEGYSLGYYPRSKMKKNRLGVAIAHANLRNYISDNLNLESMKLWHIPYRKNIFRKMDNINQCNKIVTDDLLTFHLATFLRKHVYFLEIVPSNTKIETFGQGLVYQVPKEVYL